MPALGSVVILAGLMAKELGGKKFAIILASRAGFAPMGNFFLFHFFGKKYHLPKSVCGHNSDWFWEPPQWNSDVAIIFGTSNDLQTSLNNLSPNFQEVIHAATTSCQYCMPCENNHPILICRGSKSYLQNIWQREKHFI